MQLSCVEIIFQEAYTILVTGMLGEIASDLIVFSHSRVNSILAIAAISTLASRITDSYFDQKISEPAHPFAREEKWKPRLASIFITALASSVIAATPLLKITY